LINLWWIQKRRWQWLVEEGNLAWSGLFVAGDRKTGSMVDIDEPQE